MWLAFSLDKSPSVEFQLRIAVERAFIRMEKEVRQILCHPTDQEKLKAGLPKESAIQVIISPNFSRSGVFWIGCSE